MKGVRSEPCTACPYRRDVASGVWSAEEYEKLRLYDASTGEQPYQPFACHATPDHYCNGWAIVHSARGHEFELLALRLYAPETVIPKPAVPLFGSGNEAADHGQRDIDAPSPEANKTVRRLLRKYGRLRDYDNDPGGGRVDEEREHPLT